MTAPSASPDPNDPAGAASAIVEAMACHQSGCPCQHAARKGSGLVHCPFHTDNTPSLNISVKNDTVLVHCQAGCSQEDVIAAIKDLDLWPEAEKPKETRTVVATYDYRDAAGKLLYQAVRFSPKGFAQRQPDGKGGWVWNLDGVPRVLYGLPELLAADPKRLRFIVEGEKDVETLRGLGFVATTNSAGAGKWLSEFAEWFRDRDVIVIPDFDEIGRKHMADVVVSLKDVAHSARWVDLPGSKPHWDVTDWVNAGGTVEQLKELVRQSQNGYVPPPTRDDVAWTDMADQMIDMAPEKRDVELFRLACKFCQLNVPLDAAARALGSAAERCRMDRTAAERKVSLAYARYPTGKGSLPPDVTMLGPDSVMIEFDAARIVFTEMESGAHELKADMEIDCLSPGTLAEPYMQRINLLSSSARESCVRELNNVFGKDVKWATILVRASSKARDAYRRVDRSRAIRDIPDLGEMRYMIDGLVPDDGVTILFGAGSSTKTIMTLDQAIAICTGVPWMGHATVQKNGLYVDYETGEVMWKYRGARLCQSKGIVWEDVPLKYWDARGVPFYDQADAIKHRCDEDDLGFLVVDHLAVACGMDPSEPEAATRFYRGAARIGRPIIAVAHITGEHESHPESVNKPFGTVFWSNGARRTFFMLRQQEQESSEAEVGFYCRKNNDGRKPGDFGVSVSFNDPDGPIEIRQTPLRTASSVLAAARGPEWAVFEALDHPMTLEELSGTMEDAGSPMTVRKLRSILPAHPRMFIKTQTSGGRGNVVRWCRVEAGQRFVNESEDADELPFE